MKIVFASHNTGKINELQNLVHEINLEIIPQAEFNVTEIAETGLTFVENAILKARHACKESGMPAIADDSGLVVPYLQGAPGIYSARYAGEPENSAANIKKLLEKLQHVPDENRSCHFHCTMVFMQHAEDPIPLICEGIWRGMVLKTPVGTKGFGYDPIFFDPKQKCSAAEMSIAKKNQFSHRAVALNKLSREILCLH